MIKIEVWMRVECSACGATKEAYVPASMGEAPGRFRSWGWEVISKQPGLFTPFEDKLLCPACSEGKGEAH